MNSGISPELKAQAAHALDHQKAGRYAEAAQIYSAVLARAPHIWQAAYNLGLVFQHLHRLPEAAEMYARAVRLNPELAEGFNNLGNVLKALKNDAAAIEAYQRALALKANLPEASYNLATMLQARGDLESSIGLLHQTLRTNPVQQNAWDALYRGLLGLGRPEEALNAFLDWERATPQPSPQIVVAGLASCRLLGDREREFRYVELALNWPFADFSPETFATVLGLLQYFDLSREDLLRCYQRYDAAITAGHPQIIAALPRRAAGTKLRIGYVSADFRRHVMGRMMLEVLSQHDRSQFSILLISTCPRNQHDAITEAFRTHADGFADVSALDDFAAAKSIAEADIDVLVDLAGHTMAARPGIYAHRPARTIVTHLGYHGCLGMHCIDCKLTDRLADREDAGNYQIEQPYFLSTCVFPFIKSAPSDAAPAPQNDPDLSGKFVFGAFVNLLKLSPRCLAVWRRVLDAIPEAVLLFSPFNQAERVAINRVAACAGIDISRVVVRVADYRDDTGLRARYHSVHAVMDTFPYAGGDTTLAALDMNIPVVTLRGERHSERIGASILGHLSLTELIATTEDQFVEQCTRLARDSAFLSAMRLKISEATTANAIDAKAHARALEQAFTDLAARKPVAVSMSFGPRQFFQSLHDAMRRQRAATNDDERASVAKIFAELRGQQPEYAPLLRAQAELAQAMNDLKLASGCLAEFVKQSPDDLDARLTLTGFLIDQGAAAEALTILDDIPDSAAGDIRALKLRVHAHVLLRQWDRARQYSAPAVEIASADAQALFWHGTVLSHVGECAAALTFLNRALILSPGLGEAAHNAGVLLSELGNHVDAEKVFRRAMGTSAAQSAHLRLLRVLQILGRHDEWRNEALRFVDAYGGSERAIFVESGVARLDGDLEHEARLLLPLAERLAMTPDDALAFELAPELLAILPYQDISAPLLQRLRERFKVAAHAICPPLSPPEQAGQRERSATIKLGYLVDFSLPFSTELVVSLANQHNRSRFAMSVYALSPEEFCPLDALLTAGVRVMPLAALDERLAAKRISTDELDLLIDITGGGTYAKPGLLSCRPSALQVSLPGLTWATDIGELDVRITDRSLDVGVDAGMHDALWVIDGCAIPIVPRSPVDAGLLRDTLGIAPAACVFGVFASADHISLRGLTLWKSISEQVPNAVFLLCPLNAGDAEIVRRMLQKSGIASDRILTLPLSQRPGAEADLSQVIDVVLDTLPGSDYFSVVTSLRSGIPIVTMPGKMPEERLAFSALSHLGATSLIAGSGRDYVDIAARLALDADERSACAAQLKMLWRVAASEGGAFAIQDLMRRYESAFEAMVTQNKFLRPDSRTISTKQ